MEREIMNNTFLENYFDNAAQSLDFVFLHLIVDETFYSVVYKYNLGVLNTRSFLSIKELKETWQIVVELPYNEVNILTVKELREKLRVEKNISVNSLSQFKIR